MYITNTLKIISSSTKTIENNGEFGDKLEKLNISLEDNGGYPSALVLWVETNGNPIYVGWTEMNEETGSTYDVDTSDSDWDFDNSWFSEEDLNNWVKSFNY
ncbi:hypothetical protein LVJ85_05440 [Neisseria sp. Dent CA1/247]|uniref:hypothetical protein n=1 Tax=Neisseria sp. Dent CA1/247 TaxID=2912675 RepID=UPI001FD3CEBD|nr:hypothetical protein [Neisseria sp. Dent CA1/247]UOO77904.1 hypothetical protein LVJ85_05440 [Neisseria sp. Dent CA1/247]